MGLLDGLLGNASEVPADVVQREYAKILIEGERVERAFKLVRDSFFFTNRRFILVDKQGISGRKIAYQSLPYRSIVSFSVETAGDFDLDAELKIWVSSRHEPLALQFNKKVDVYEVQALLASHVTK